MKDTVIYERLGGDQPFKDVTLEHLEEFANIGQQHLSFNSAFIICVENTN